MTTVLVVDDSAVDRRLAGGLLEKGSSVQVVYACDGHEALNIMRRETPDLVVTDMQMPEMNGLELVVSVRAEFSSTPVILMTGKGSEELAVSALQSGAASYVPKSSLADELLPTAMNVLSMSRADANSDRMMSCVTKCMWEFEMENDYTLIAPLAHLIRHSASSLNLVDDMGRVQLGIAVEEALSNALYHGNLGISSEEMKEVGYDLNGSKETNLVEERKSETPYKDRKISVRAELTAEQARIVVRDQGTGFDYAGAPQPGDTLGSDNIGGRGLTHMRLFVDEVQFNDTGNEVTLIKRASNS